MLKKIVEYLNLPSTVLLNDFPFKSWLVEKSIDDDLVPPIIQYVFPENGLALRCNRDDEVTAIFLDSGKLGSLTDNFTELPFSSTRQQVLDFFGVPSKSSKGFKDPVLGEYGPWDRFSKLNYSVHIEYSVKNDNIKKITYMRADLVP